MARKSPVKPAEKVAYDHRRPAHAVKAPPVTERLRQISDECVRRLYWALRPASRPKNFRLP